MPRAAYWFGVAVSSFLMVGGSCSAAPPPPGWAEAYRARVCGTAPSITSIDMVVRQVDAADAGVRVSKSSPVRFGWAVDLDLPKDVQPIGITVSYSRGVLLLAADGRWIQIATPKAAVISGDKAQSVPISDGARPKAVTEDLDGTVATIQEDGTTIARYDFSVCGFGARAQQAFRLPRGATGNVIAEISPNLGGFSNDGYILVAGNQNGRPGQLLSVPVDGDVERPLGPAIVSSARGEALVLLSDYDIAGGCDGIAGFRSARGTVTISTFCKPGFSDVTTLLAGDVGLPVSRTPGAVREPVALAKFSVPVFGASSSPWLDHGRAMLLVLAKGQAGSTRVIALSGKAADYPIKQ